MTDPEHYQPRHGYKRIRSRICKVSTYEEGNEAKKRLCERQSPKMHHRIGEGHEENHKSKSIRMSETERASHAAFGITQSRFFHNSQLPKNNGKYRNCKGCHENQFGYFADTDFFRR